MDGDTTTMTILLYLKFLKFFLCGISNWIFKNISVKNSGICEMYENGHSLLEKAVRFLFACIETTDLISLNSVLSFLHFFVCQCCYADTLSLSNANLHFLLG